MKTLKIISNCIIFMILTLLISCEKPENEPEFEPHSVLNLRSFEWSQTFGGSDKDYAYSVQQTTDGDYILAGCTRSYGADKYDAWLIETDAEGVEQWSQTFGGSDKDYAYSVQQTTDGGYILAGKTKSYGAGNYDAWLIKTNAEGAEQWSQTFGGSDWDQAYSVQQTTDGGYILAGNTYSYGAGGYDVWLIKTDAEGVEQWSQTFGGSGWDQAYSVQQTTDGGYILAGKTKSYGAGKYDAWLIKTDAMGAEQWSQTFGGYGKDYVYSVQQTTDGGYILAGETGSYGVGKYDVWLIKTDAEGIEQWSQTFGGSDDDRVRSVQQTTDGGYILAGNTYSYGTGYGDAWLIKTNAMGTEQWTQTFSGSYAKSVQQTADGDYIIAGFTDSYETDDCDALLIKVRH